MSCPYKQFAKFMEVWFCIINYRDCRFEGDYRLCKIYLEKIKVENDIKIDDK